MDVLGALKVGGGVASEVKSIVWASTTIDISLSIAPTAQSAYTAVAVGFRTNHNVIAEWGSATTSAKGAVFHGAACLTADTVTLTCYNPAAAICSGASAEPVLVVGWR
jgi:hypothetical protein